MNGSPVNLLNFDPAMLVPLIPVLIIVAVLIGWALIDIVRRPVQYLPKWVWALIVLLVIPLGAVIYLVIGRGRHHVDADGTPGSFRTRIGEAPYTAAHRGYRVRRMRPLSKSRIKPTKPATRCIGSSCTKFGPYALQRNSALRESHGLRYALERSAPIALPSTQ